MIRGIDVSSHQERIDWGRVKADGVAFVLIKATEGVGFVDPKYSAHSAGGRSVRLPQGAYHFARPDTRSGGTVAATRRDAEAEADAFLAVALPARGDLLPALDLETAGLPPKLMVEWTRTWLGHVGRRIGARPMLYTYPAFWSRLGGTKAFRLHPLWIANYEVDAPKLPAGWSRFTIWQYTSKGTVDGIPGRVDVNRLNNRVTLARVTYKPRKRSGPSRPEQHFPGPVPKPGWFWPWLRWRLGIGEFEGLAQVEQVRPDEAPARIPEWAFASAEKLVAERNARATS